MADAYLVDENSLRFTPVSELQKKKLKLNEELYRQKQAALEVADTKAKERKDKMVEKLNKYNEIYKTEAEEIEKKRLEVKQKGGFFKPSDPKIILVVRIKGVNKLSPSVRKVFQLFRLTQIHNATFIKVNKATINMLRIIEPFVSYGYPSLELIRKLIYKRGYVRIGPKGSKARIRITDNEQIESHLGQYNVCGVEDMVNQIYTCGEHFKQVNNFLWVFKLNSPRKGFVCKRHGFAEFRKGDWGNAEEYIDDLVNRMI